MDVWQYKWSKNIHLYDKNDEVQAFEEQRLFENTDKEDDSYYIPSAPMDRNLSQDELKQKATRFRDEIAKATWERSC